MRYLVLRDGKARGYEELRPLGRLAEGLILQRARR